MRPACKTVVPWMSLCLSLLAKPVLAQVADVPSPNREGDFLTALVRGNRGYYANSSWLVVEPAESDGGQDTLNCRYRPNGPIRSKIKTGSIITAEFSGTALQISEGDRRADAIVMHLNQPWLRIRGTDPLTYPDRSGDTVNPLGICYVRANLQYIAPINEEAIRARGLTPQINPTNPASNP